MEYTDAKRSSNYGLRVMIRLKNDWDERYDDMNTHFSLTLGHVGLTTNTSPEINNTTKHLTDRISLPVLFLLMKSASLIKTT